MAIKKMVIEDQSGLAGEYCYIVRDVDGFVLENSAAEGNTPGEFYDPASVTDIKIPLTENEYLPGVYEATENRIPFNDGRYSVRYCIADDSIIASEEWKLLNDVVSDIVDVNVVSQNDLIDVIKSLLNQSRNMPVASQSGTQFAGSTGTASIGGIKKVINERTTLLAQLIFYDETAVAVVPASARYRLDDVPSARAILGWTSFSPTETTYDLIITDAQNAILDTTLESERKRLTVEFTFDSDNKKSTSEYIYTVRNLLEIT